MRRLPSLRRASPGDELADALTRALGTPDDQTVLRRSGILAKASEEGATFFEMPSAVAENAVDGNPSTSWIFGDFRRAPGMSLDLTLPQSERLDTVTISQADLGPVGIALLVVIGYDLP